MKIKTVEIAKALGFEVQETKVEINGETSTEYNIIYEGKTAEEIALIADYLKYIEYLSKWNGELPDVIAGDSASIMIPINPAE